MTDDDPAWDCSDCGRRFGNREKPYKNLAVRSRDEWTELVKAMMPKPVQTSAEGDLLAGDPVVVIVSVEATTIRIMEAGIDWVGPHTPTTTGRPFAKVPFRTPATRVAELVASAWAKRVSRYRWCPQCRQTLEPEHMNQGNVCDGCATKLFGVVF